MQTIIKSVDRTITSEEVISLLEDYGMLSRLAYEDIIERAIALIDCTPEEIKFITNLWQKQTEKVGLPYVSKQELITIAIRNLKIEKFKQKKWGDQIPAYFTRRKPKLDRVVYSIITTKKKEIANEIHFRLVAKEQTFTELAQETAENLEVEVKERIGLIELGNLPPFLAQNLAHLQINSCSIPIAMDEWFVILRLDKYISVKCDRQIQQRLLKELFDAWMQKQLAQQKYHIETIQSPK